MFLRFLNYKKAIAFLFIFVFIGALTLGDFKRPENSIAEVCIGVQVSNTPRYSIPVGDELYSFNSSRLEVIDVPTGEVTDIINLPIISSAALVGDILYVNSQGDFYTIDTTTKAFSSFASIDSSGGFFIPIVGNSLYFFQGDIMYVVDTDSNTIETSIDIDSLINNAVSVGTNVYALTSNDIYVIDTNTNTLSTTIDASQSFIEALVGTDLYITQLQSVVVLDTNTNTLTDTILSTGDKASIISVGQYLYVTSVLDGVFMEVIDTTTNTIVETITLVDTPGFFSTLDSLFLFGTDLYSLTTNLAGDSYVHIIDTLTNTLSESIYFESSVWHISSDDNFIYISDTSENKVFIFDTNNNTFKDDCIPILESSEIDGYTLTLTYDEDLDEGSIPGIDSFTIEIDSVLVPVQEVSVVGDTVNLTMSSPAYYGDMVTMSYIVPLIGSTKDLYGNDALAITDRLVVNNTTTCAVINVGSVPYSGTLVGNNLYINNSDSLNISVIDTLNYEVLETIDIGANIYYSTLVGTDLYVFGYGTETVIVDTLTNTVSDSLPAGSASYFSGTLVNTDLYVTNIDTGEVEVLNTLDNTVSETIIVGAGPYSSVLAGDDLYVFNSFEDTVSVIDTLTNTVSETVTVGLSPYSGTLVGSDLYVNNYGDGTISVLDTITNTVSETIALSSGPQFSVLVGDNLYTTLPDENSIAVVDTGDNTVLDTYEMSHDTEGAPYFLNLVNDNIYVTNAVSVVYIIDPDTNDIYSCPATFNLNYSAGANGSIDGDTSQTLEVGEDGTPVTAVPDDGYEFAGWSDDTNDNPRTDLNVSANISVTASFVLASVSSPTTGSSNSGTAAYARFRNLVEMGKYEEAYSIVNDFPQMFTSGGYGPYDFCDNALFVDFMKMRDVDGKYSAYNGGVVKEVSKLQTFINKLMVSQYIQASGPIDGIFGPLTKIGVERLQNLLNGSMELKNDLAVDGIVGPYTRSAINDFCLPGNFSSKSIN